GPPDRGGYVGRSSRQGRRRPGQPGGRVPRPHRARGRRRASRAGTIAWIARHEGRLAWRDLLWMVTAGRRRRAYTVALGFVAFLLFMHGFATLMLAPYDLDAGAPDKRMLVILTGTLVLSWSLMLSQAMEAVTRAFYARADFDLVLSSPLAAWRLFAVRIGAMALTITLMALALTAPFINVLA